ncbi:MAG: hypothetical protein ABL959_20760 [Pyrinomonadaceae bacterium]|jgi:hypothetical protein
MNKMKLAIALIPLFVSAACATRPCQKNELLGTGSLGRKFGTDNLPIKEAPDGTDFTYSMTSEKSSFMFSIPSAAESPEPIMELVQDKKKIRLKPYCGGWHQYNPYGHTWRAGVVTPKGQDGEYRLCITVPIVGKGEPLTDCSTQVSLNQAFGEKSRKQTEQLRKKNKAARGAASN